MTRSARRVRTAIIAAAGLPIVVLAIDIAATAGRRWS